jgi:hypothetical protein
MASNTIYLSDFGRVPLPSDFPSDYPKRKNGRPDRRFKICQMIGRYENYLARQVEKAYIRGADICKFQPKLSFQKWVNRHGN